jgi:hypothetical protein
LCFKRKTNLSKKFVVSLKTTSIYQVFLFFLSMALKSFENLNEEIFAICECGVKIAGREEFDKGFCNLGHKYEFCKSDELIERGKYSPA